MRYQWDLGGFTAFGALSFDVTQSIARLSGEGTLSGAHTELTILNDLKSSDSQIQFAGYRFQNEVI